MAPPSKPNLPVVLSVMLGRWFPWLFGFTEHDVKRIFPYMKKVFGESLRESGYMHIQATKPDTAGESLANVSLPYQYY